MDVDGHPLGAPEEASPLGLPEHCPQAGPEKAHEVPSAGLPDPVEYDVGAGDVPASVFEDCDGGLDGSLCHGCEEEYVPDRVSCVFSLGAALRMGPFWRAFSINL